ncbi:hypothetical protein V7654_11760 [Bacillus sp. JJ1609]|uniref:hypothetical protein n=1 Tax=Bacillus sp. JJ1609 TaxID=3122977 RepID=UPI003000C68B
MTAKEAIEKNYEHYNNKNFAAYFDMQSERLQEEMIKTSKMSREDLILGWKKSWIPAEVIKIESESGGTDEGTIVTATVHYPSTLLSPETTTQTTYELIKENGEWKVDEVVKTEQLAKH